MDGPILCYVVLFKFLVICLLAESIEAESYGVCSNCVGKVVADVSRCCGHTKMRRSTQTRGGPEDFHRRLQRTVIGASGMVAAVSQDVPVSNKTLLAAA